MDIGVVKPFELNRSATSGVSVEAGTGQKTLAKSSQVTAQPVAQPIAAQTREAVDQARPAERMEPEDLQAVVSDMQNFVQSVRRDINFQLDDTSGQVVINVTEATSGDVIRQIPSEEALRLSESLSEIRSLLFEAEA